MIYIKIWRFIHQRFDDPDKKMGFAFSAWQISDLMKKELNLDVRSNSVSIIIYFLVLIGRVYPVHSFLHANDAYIFKRWLPPLHRCDSDRGER